MAYGMKYTKGGFPFKSPMKNESATSEMMQQLDDQITNAKKLGNDGAAQVLLNKKSKLMDELTRKKREGQDDPGSKYDPAADLE